MADLETAHATLDHSGITGAGVPQPLDTTDSPQFAGVNVGAATDTTITRTGAGEIAVEGNRIFRVGGADVPIADGGTGASTKAAAFDALSPMTTQDDIIIGGASGTGTRLGKGSDGEILTVDPITHHLAWKPNAGVADILDLPTAETDSSLVLAPDGAGGVEFRAEAGGGGGGASRMPLDSYSLDGTYGDDFTASSLAGAWTRRNFTAAETFQLGQAATWMRIPLNGRSVGDGYFRTAPGGDWTFMMSYVSRNFDTISPVIMWGLAVVDTNGTGVAATYGNNSPAAFDTIAVTTYSTYGGSYVEMGLPGTAPNIGYSGLNIHSVQHKTWLRLRKSGTNYYGAFSWDGEIWSPESAAIAWAGTVDRVGMLFCPLSSGTLTNAYIDVDIFNKI